MLRSSPLTGSTAGAHPQALECLSQDGGPPFPTGHPQPCRVLNYTTDDPLKAVASPCTAWVYHPWHLYKSTCSWTIQWNVHTVIDSRQQWCIPEGGHPALYPSSTTGFHSRQLWGKPQPQSGCPAFNPSSTTSFYSRQMWGEPQPQSGHPSAKPCSSTGPGEWVQWIAHAVGTQSQWAAGRSGHHFRRGCQCTWGLPQHAAIRSAEQIGQCAWGVP